MHTGAGTTKTSLQSFQTNLQKGDYFLLSISSLTLLFCAGTALCSGKDTIKTWHQIKTLKTELDEIKKDPTYQKLENIEYSQNHEDKSQGGK